MLSVVLRRFHQTQYIKPRTQFHTYDADDVLELLKHRDQDTTLERLLAIWQQEVF